MAARWLRRSAVDPKDTGSIPAVVAAFQMEGKSECPCVEISAQVINKSELVNINPAPSTVHGVPHIDQVQLGNKHNKMRSPKITALRLSEELDQLTEFSFDFSGFW